MNTARAPRRDVGQVRLTKRDLQVLSWMMEQYGIRKDQLPRLLGGLGDRTTRALLDRWVRAGLVNRRKIFTHDPAWVWPSRAGLDLLERPFAYWEPRPGILEHVLWVNAVRLRVTERHPDATWVSERRLRSEAGGANRPEHMPDAVVLKAGKKIVVEVQLAHKSRERSVATLSSLTDEYDGAWVFVRGGGPRQAIESALESFSPARAGKVRLLPLEDEP